MKKNYQIQNKKQLKAQLLSIKLNLRAQELGIQEDAKAYLHHTASRILGKNKKNKPPVLGAKSVNRFFEGKVLIHILPRFVKGYLMKRSGWLSRSLANMFAKKIGRSLDKTYFEPK
jgi:hypothetical protein